MPYCVHKLCARPLRRVEPLGEFERTAQASACAKARRAAPSCIGDDD